MVVPDETAPQALQSRFEEVAPAAEHEIEQPHRAFPFGFRRFQPSHLQAGTEHLPYGSVG